MRSQLRSEDIVRFGKPDDCPKCPKYKTCSEMCELVERWVNQDYKGRGSKELLEVTRNIDIGLFPKPIDFVDYAHQRNKDLVSDLRDPVLAKRAWDVVSSIRLSPRSMKFVGLYYREGKSLTTIAKILKISAQACHFQHLALKKEIVDRFSRIEIWKEVERYFDELDESSTKSDVSVLLYFGGLYSIKDIEVIFGISRDTSSKAISMIKSRYA